MRKYLLLVMVWFAAVIAVKAQERTVTGRVTATEDGSSIPGVNVLLKGTTKGTVTDSEGRYSIAVPANGGTLTFSFIGFTTQEAEVGDRSVIDIALITDAVQLSEVVVTAAGIERDKKALSYAVQNVSGNEVIQKSEPDVLRMLQGKVPGLNIAGSGGIAGSSTRITIRGVNSFVGSNQPLIVVDGIPYNNDVSVTTPAVAGGALASNRLADLDNNNIASITTLNGAGAAALYGTRAANGVIVITTKSGSAKTSKKGLEGSFSTSYSIEEVANLPVYQNKYGTGSQSVFAHANGTWGPAYSLLDSTTFFPGYVEAFPSKYGINGNPANPILTKYQAYPNNVEDFFEKGQVIENSISLTGGNEKASVSAVISDLKQTGFIPESKFARTNFSLGSNAELDNGIILGANFQYSKTRQDGPIVGNTGASPFSRLLFQPRNWPLQDLPYINPANGRSVYFFPFGSGVDNPYWSVKNNLFNSDVDRIAASLNVGRDITEWLNITLRAGYNTFNDRRTQVVDKGSAALAQNIGSVTLDNIFFSELESNFLLTFDKSITKDLNLKAILGHNFNQRVNDRQSVTSLGIIANDIFDLDNTATVQPNGGTYDKRKLWAVYTDLTLGFKNYAFLNATLRNDNSSTLPANNRSYFYYNTSAAIILTDAFPALKSKILANAKVRGGYSRVGRDASPYQLFNTVTILTNDGFGNGGQVTRFPFNGLPGATVPGTSFNPNLRPEFTDEFEVGANISFLESRISLDLTYYDRKTTQTIAERAVPSASGFTTLYDNFGQISNKGWEIGLNADVVKLSNGFNWNIFTSFTSNKNNVDKLSEGVEELSIVGVFTTATSVARPGYPSGVIRGTVAARDDQGRLLIDPTTGLTIPHTQQEIIADPNPKFILGVTNSFTWKGITLSGLIEWKQGGQLYSTTTAFLLGRGTTRDTEDRDVPKVVPGVLGNPNTLQPIGDANGDAIINTIQVMDNNLWFQAQGGGSFAINSPTEFSVFDATTIRLREVSLAYSLPKSLFNKGFISGVNISLSGRNLWYRAPYFPRYTNFDPEVSSLGASNAQGFDINAAPTTKRYGMNVRISF